MIQRVQFYSYVFDLIDKKKYLKVRTGSKYQSKFTLNWLRRITSMNSIFGTILAIFGSDGFGCLFFGFETVGRPDESSPLFDRILGNEFHSNSVVRCHEIDESGKERFSLVLSIELFSLILWELEHLEIGNRELFLSLGNDFSNIEIRIGLDHAIGAEFNKKLPFSLISMSNKSLSSKLVSKVNNFQLPIVAYNDIADKQVVYTDIGVGDFLKEHFLILDIILCE